MANDCGTNYTSQITTCNPCVIPGTPLWNLFSQDGNCEAQLFASLIEEFTDIAGFPIKYWISTNNADFLFGEDATGGFLPAATSKLIYEPTEEASIVEAFGFRGDDLLQYCMMPKIMFIRDIGPSFLTYRPSGSIQPFIGDVITTLWNSRNYEIVDVGSEEKIFMGKKHIWELILRPFNFSNECTSARDIHMNQGNIDDLEIIESEMEEGPGIEEKKYPTIKYGDNSWIEDESNDIDPYADVDKSIFGL